MNTIADRWIEFEKLIHPDAKDVQRKAMRRSFYAGAIAILSITMKIGDDSISEDAGCAIMDGLHQEAKMFALQILNGDA